MWTRYEKTTVVHSSLTSVLNEHQRTSRDLRIEAELLLLRTRLACIVDRMESGNIFLVRLCDDYGHDYG